MSISNSIASFDSFGKISQQHARMAAVGSKLSESSVLPHFDSLLRSTQSDNEQSEMRAKVRDVAQKYVAQSLVQPLLKQAREQRDDTPPFGATQAEKQFGALMDERTAIDMVKRGNWGLVANIEKRLLRAAGIETPIAPKENTVVMDPEAA